MSWQSTMWFIFSNSVLSHRSGIIFLVFSFFLHKWKSDWDFMRVAWSPLLIVVVDTVCHCREAWVGFTVWKMVTELEKNCSIESNYLCAIMGCKASKTACSVCVMHNNREDRNPHTMLSNDCSLCVLCKHLCTLDKAIWSSAWFHP